MKNFLAVGFFVYTGAATTWYDELDDKQRTRITNDWIYTYMLTCPFVNLAWKYTFDFILQRTAKGKTAVGTNCHLGPAIYPNIHYTSGLGITRVGFCFSAFDWANKEYFKDHKGGFEFFVGDANNFNYSAARTAANSFFVSHNLFLNRFFKRGILSYFDFGFELRPINYQTNRFLRLVFHIGTANFSCKVDFFHFGLNKKNP